MANSAEFVETRLVDFDLCALRRDGSSDEQVLESTQAYEDLQQLGGLLAALEQRLCAAPESVGSDGRYQILSPLDCGDFPTVFVARDTRLDRKVIIKVPHPIRANRVGDSVAHEGRALAGLPNRSGVVTVFDADEDGDFIVMEYLAGCTLQDVIDANGTSEKGEREGAAKLLRALRSTNERVRCLIAIADAISHCHKYGVVHRDIKPANIVFRENDPARPCLVDLGLAHFEGDEIANDTLRGTLPYLSPEQFESGKLESRPVGDQYSFGVVAFQFLTGLQLPDRPTATQAETALKNFDKDLRALMVKALSRNPEQRYDSVAELRDDLAAYLANRPVTARRTWLGRRVALFVRRNRVSVGLLLVTLALMLSAHVVSATLDLEDIRGTLDEARNQSGRTPQEHELVSVRYAKLMSRAQLFDESAGGLFTVDVLPDVRSAASEYVVSSRAQFDEHAAESEKSGGSINDDEWAELFALQTAMYGEELAPTHRLMSRGKVVYPLLAEGRLELLVQDVIKNSLYAGSNAELLSGVTIWRQEKQSSWLAPGSYRLLHVAPSGVILSELGFRRLEVSTAEILLNMPGEGTAWIAGSVLIPNHQWSITKPSGPNFSEAILEKSICSYRLSPLVTWRQFAGFCDSTGRSFVADKSALDLDVPALVKWHEATAYAEWAGARLPGPRDLAQAMHSEVLSEADRQYLFPTSLAARRNGEWVGEVNLREGVDRCYFVSDSVLRDEPLGVDLIYLEESPAGNQSWRIATGSVKVGICFRLARTEATFDEFMRAQRNTDLK